MKETPPDPIEIRKAAARKCAKGGLLKIPQVQRILDLSYSGVSSYLENGILTKVKKGPERSRAPVRVTLQSVIDHLDSWTVG